MAPNLPTRHKPHKPVLSLTSPSGGIYIAEVKWRNQLLALFCLLVFAAFGVLYFRYWVVQKPFGIILFIGEGLTADRLAALRMYAANPETPLTLDTLTHTALLKNYSNNSATPDSAAAATALATGVKVNNGAIGIDPTGTPLTNLLELARASGRTTGLVTDSRLTSATAAAFYAHTAEQDETQELARTLAENANIDIVMGGGSTDFLPEGSGGARSDGRDLLSEIDDAGYDLVRTRTELEAVPWWRWPKVFGVFGSAELSHGDELGPETPQPSLSDMVRRAIELLQIHRGGYLLVVDGGLMRRAAERNDVEATLAAMLEFDRAVSVALRFAGAKTTVFVCGDVAIGGLSVNGFPPRSAGRSELLANGSLGETRLTWATGPNGHRHADAPPAPSAARVERGGDADAATPSPTSDSADTPLIAENEASDSQTLDHSADPAAAPPTTPLPSQIPRDGEPAGPAESAAPAQFGSVQAPAAIYAPTAWNGAEDMIAFGNGRGAEALHGTLESTALFEIIRDNL